MNLNMTERNVAKVEIERSVIDGDDSAARKNRAHMTTQFDLSRDDDKLIPRLREGLNILVSFVLVILE